MKKKMIRQKKQRINPQKKRLLIVMGGLLCFLFSWVFFAPNSGLIKYWGEKRKLEQLERENNRLVAENDQLVEEIRLLRVDEAHLEWVAREKHGLLKKNESVYEFKKKKDNKEK